MNRPAGEKRHSKICRTVVRVYGNMVQRKQISISEAAAVMESFERNFEVAYRTLIHGRFSQ